MEPSDRSLLPPLNATGVADGWTSTPSTARTTRSAVIQHAVASQQKLVSLLERPSPMSSACAVLSELEAHLSEAGVRTERYKSMALQSVPHRLSGFGGWER